ncbi:MAG: rhodanese-like domain-containing protein [Bacteroidota bacterium]
MRLAILLFFSLGCSIALGQTVVEKIDNEKLVELMKSPGVQLVDVRTPGEVQKGYIEGAIHIDYFDQNFEKLANKLDKNKPIIVYCAVGGRSAKSGERLVTMGFTKIYDLAGGITKWKQEGFPLIK